MPTIRLRIPRLTELERQEVEALEAHQGARRVHESSNARAVRLEEALTHAEEEASEARKEREKAKIALHAQLSNG